MLNLSDFLQLSLQKYEGASIIEFSIDEILRYANFRKVFHCEFCESVFADHISVIHHSSIQHAPSSAYSCNSCGLHELNLKDIMMHRRFDCMLYQYNRLPLIWLCNVCNIELRGSEQLAQHRHETSHFFPRIEPAYNDVRVHCELCNASFGTTEDLVTHFKSKHREKSKLKVNEEPKTSTRVAATPSRRGGGHQTSTRPRAYLCDVCGKSYTQSSHLWQHLRFHQGVKPFACNFEGCDRRFTIRPDLNDHVRKCHTGERKSIIKLNLHILQCSFLRSLRVHRLFQALPDRLSVLSASSHSPRRASLWLRRMWQALLPCRCSQESFGKFPIDHQQQHPHIFGF